RPATRCCPYTTLFRSKSSLVKAMLAKFADQGLRLIEVDKSDLGDLGYIIDLISTRPEHFIIFSDDLSFEEGEAGYKALKSVLDGDRKSTRLNSSHVKI